MMRFILFLLALPLLSWVCIEFPIFKAKQTSTSQEVRIRKIPGIDVTKVPKEAPPEYALEQTQYHF